MVITSALHAAMEVLDNHADKMGSGPYCELAKEMKSVADSMCEHETETQRAFAIELLVDVPAAAAASGVDRFMRDHEFMSTLVRRKGVQLQSYEPYSAAIMGHAWKVEITEALIFLGGASTLVDVRRGVLTLLVARSGFLPQIVNRLNKEGITPRMLCPLDLNETPVLGDCDARPLAEDILQHEPRMLRWLLGMGELEKWPQLVAGEDSPHVSHLVQVANNGGGDDENVNEPCACDDCMGVRIPTMDKSVFSIELPESGLELGDEILS